MDTSASNMGNATSQAKAVDFHKGPHIAPDFRIYFDLVLASQPGQRDFTFDTNHQFLFLEIAPTPEISFSFDVSSAPRFFELDYQLNPRIQLRAGKIWIPWDDLSPHNIYGGRVNVSKLQISGGAAFLPDIWTDLGVGIRFTGMDTAALKILADLYMVNGFGSGGKDPSADTANPPEAYPSFSDLPSSADNNRDKAIGGRVQATFARRLSVGASVYTGRWNAQNAPESYRVNMGGLDSQLRLGYTEFRGGISAFFVGIPPGSSPAGENVSITRGGWYLEAGQRFGNEGKWKLLGRGGMVQLDNRVKAVSDQTLVGGAIVWKPNALQLSFETSRDLNSDVGKANYTYSAFRLVVAL
jgi:hypothetical protein